jgi:methenyltetrahydromethanopterin cyclohydrolase
MDLGLNRRAARLTDALAADAALLGIAATELGSGARLIDCGVAVAGGLEAGRRLAEVCLAGLATVSITSVEVGGLWLPAVAVTTDHPVTACLASQYAGWAIDPPGYFAMGSGPARSVARVERELYERIGYAEVADTAVLVLEGRALPDQGVVRFVAEKCRVRPEGLRLLIAPTASIAGCVQVAARSVETGLHKMLELGFDVRAVRSGTGVCPLAPVAKNDLRAIGWTNDCILYGTRAYFAVHADDEAVAAMVERLPATTSPDYGTPFYEIFKRAGNDFYKIDRMLFSPAEVVVNNLGSGRVFRAGRLDPDVLKASFGVGGAGGAGGVGGAGRIGGDVGGGGGGGLRGAGDAPGAA